MVRELLVLWDLDGTLVTAPGLGDQMYREVYRMLFGRALGPIAPKAGRTDRAIMLETLAMAGIASPHAHVDAFLTAYAQHIRAMDGSLTGTGAVRALPGAAGAIAALAGSDTAGSLTAAGTAARTAAVRVRQSVLTGNIRPGAELKLRLAGLTRHLDLAAGAFGDAHVVRAELVNAARAAAAAAYGVSFAGTATVLIGDTPLDVEAGLATGARVVGVATGGYSPADLAVAGAHAVLPDLTDPEAVRAVVLELRSCTMDMKLEVIPLPVRDVDAAKDFYVNQVRFALDHDIEPGNGMRIVQMTPPGSACSVVIGTGLPLGEPGSVKGVQLVVEDLDTLRAELAGRGVDITPVQQLGPEGTPGSRFCFFPDPDGNLWAVQEYTRS